MEGMEEKGRWKKFKIQGDEHGVTIKTRDDSKIAPFSA